MNHSLRAPTHSNSRLPAAKALPKFSFRKADKTCAAALIASGLLVTSWSALAAQAFWSGNTNNLWSGTNFSPDTTGAVSGLLVAGSDVVFSVTGVAPQNQATILDVPAIIGSLTVNDPVAVSISGPNTLTIAGGGITINAGAALTSINSGVALGILPQSVTVNNAAGLVINGVLSGSNAMTKLGTGQLTLTGAETFTGSTLISAGTLQVGDGATAGTSIGASNLVTVASGATLAIKLANGGTFTNSVSNLGIVESRAAGINTLSGGISGTGAFLQSGIGLTLFSGANTYTGLTTVSDGTLQVGNGTSGSIAAVSPVVISGGTLIINLASGGTFANNVANGSVLTTIAASTNTLSGVTSGTGTLIQNGPGTTILSGANTYTGATHVAQGTLQIGNGVTGSIAATSPVSVSAGTLAIDLANGGTLANNIANSALVTTIGTGTNTLSGVTSGTGAFTQAGTGTTILSGANTYTGATTVLAGVLQAGAANVISTASAVLVNAGSVFDLNSQAQSVGSVADGPAGGGTITLGSARLTTGNDNTDTQFSGTLRGSGNVRKVGTGTWTLSGANTYTGSTNIVAGTLQAGAAHVISKASGVNVATGATFNLDGFDQSIGSLRGAGFVRLGAAQLTTGNDGRSTLYSGTMSGNGTLEKVGVGTFELTGTNTYTGLTTVRAGTLAVDGSILGSMIVTGGTLRGVGRIGGSVINDSMVSPGRAGAPGKLTIGGDYVQHQAGTLNIRLASTSDYDQLAIGGKANFDGTLKVAYQGAFNAQPGDVFQIASANAGVLSRFASFEDPHVTGTLLTLGVVYKPNAVRLEFVQGSFAALASSYGLSANERAVARALDKLADHHFTNRLIRHLDTFQFADVPAQLNVLSPEDLTSIFTAGLALSELQVGNLERRLEDVRMGATGFSDAGFAASDSHGTRNYDGKSTVRTESKGGDSKSSKEVVPMVETGKRWGFFISGTGELGDLDSTGAARGSSFTTGGVTVGADYRVSSHLVLGAALGYANTSSDLSRGGSLDIDSGKGSLYGTYYEQGFFVNGIVGGGFGSYDTKRRTVGGFASGSTDATDFNALLGTGYDHHIGAWTVGPVASIQYASVGIDGFSEHGALGSVHIDSQTQESLKSAVGLKASYTKKLGRIILTPEARVQWQHEYLDSESSLGASFSSHSSFSVNGPKVGRDGVLVDVGASAQVSANVALFAYYTGELARENYTVHSVNAGVRVNF